MKSNLSVAQASPLETRRAALLIQRNVLVEQFVRAAQNNGRLSRSYREIKSTNAFLNILDEIAVGMPPKTTRTIPRFVVSSYFLHECFKKLTADSSEQFSFITGVEVDGALVLNQLLELQHDKRTAMGVTAQASFTHRSLITLERFKHRLLAHFHSHPGNGPESTHPSVPELLHSNFGNRSTFWTMTISSQIGRSSRKLLFSPTVLVVTSSCLAPGRTDFFSEHLLSVLHPTACGHSSGKKLFMHTKENPLSFFTGGIRWTKLL